MAKGNMLLGYSRGSVGDIVMSRSKGQQIQRARNRNPKNPKTKAQMLQRVKFASVVEFFRRGNQNLFQFAFENKKATQSDYNAFVAANADKGIYLTPEQLKNPNFPIVAPFIMTQGSLSRPIVYGNQYFAYGGVAGYNGEEITDVAALSTFLVSKGFSIGDIVTIVAINGQVQVNNEKPYSSLSDVQWVIAQFVVNTDDTSTLASHGVANAAATPDGFLPLKVAGNTSEIMGCVIVSRKEPTGLKVTNTTLALDTSTEGANAAAIAPAWADECINIWGASEEAILQGSLS